MSQSRTLYASPWLRDGNERKREARVSIQLISFCDIVMNVALDVQVLSPLPSHGT